MTTTGEPALSPIVTFMAGEVGMPERLLAQHVDDGTGHCLVCSAGPQAGRKVWPCPSYGLAALALEHGPAGPR